MKSEDVQFCWLCVSIWSNMSTLPSNHRALLSRWCSELAKLGYVVLHFRSSIFEQQKRVQQSRFVNPCIYTYVFQNPPWNQSMLMAFVLFCMRGPPTSRFDDWRGHFVWQNFSPRSDLFKHGFCLWGCLACHLHAHKHRRAWAVSESKGDRKAHNSFGSYKIILMWRMWTSDPGKGGVLRMWQVLFLRSFGWCDVRLKIGGTGISATGLKVSSLPGVDESTVLAVLSPGVPR